MFNLISFFFLANIIFAVMVVGAAMGAAMGGGMVNEQKFWQAMKDQYFRQWLQDVIFSTPSQLPQSSLQSSPQQELQSTLQQGLQPTLQSSLQSSPQQELQPTPQQELQSSLQQQQVVELNPASLSEPFVIPPPRMIESMTNVQPSIKAKSMLPITTPDSVLSVIPPTRIVKPELMLPINTPVSASNPAAVIFQTPLIAPNPTIAAVITPNLKAPTTQPNIAAPTPQPTQKSLLVKASEPSAKASEKSGEARTSSVEKKESMVKMDATKTLKEKSKPTSAKLFTPTDSQAYIASSSINQERVTINHLVYLLLLTRTINQLVW